MLRYVDLLAAHKLNVPHLHLTDDQGWRVEIQRHTRLTGTPHAANAIGTQANLWTEVAEDRGRAGLPGAPPARRVRRSGLVGPVGPG
ncbi:family 20 glycosylhydrolase [Actinoallomurus sp. NPDC050550]|uniref:family 20 glycosylhydrolase n=1 Tax=Actinoallomurus sp. NPDC050550 TaxID=3154937 RepID=UPI003401F5E7